MSTVGYNSSTGYRLLLVVVIGDERWIVLVWVLFDTEEAGGTSSSSSYGSRYLLLYFSVFGDMGLLVLLSSCDDVEGCCDDFHGRLGAVDAD